MWVGREGPWWAGGGWDGWTWRDVCGVGGVGAEGREAVTVLYGEIYRGAVMDGEWTGVWVGSGASGVEWADVGVV